MTAANPDHVVGELPGVIGSEKVFVITDGGLVKKLTVVEDIQPEDAGVAPAGRARILEDRVKGVGGAIGVRQFPMGSNVSKAPLPMAKMNSLVKFELKI